MCTCTSCKATDALAGWNRRASGWWRRLPDGRLLPDRTAGGFERWPRGEPAGPRACAHDYAMHVSHGKSGLAAGWAFRPGAAPHYPFVGAPRLPYPSKLVADFIAAGYKKTGQAEAQPASPAAPGKVPQHFPEPDRQPEACRIYAMPKRQPKPKQPRGRPPIAGRHVLVKLEERHIERAGVLGGGNVAAGIRKALSGRQSSG